MYTIDQFLERLAFISESNDFDPVWWSLDGGEPCHEAMRLSDHFPMTRSIELQEDVVTAVAMSYGYDQTRPGATPYEAGIWLNMNIWDVCRVLNCAESQAFAEAEKDGLALRARLTQATCLTDNIDIDPDDM